MAEPAPDSLTRAFSRFAMKAGSIASGFQGCYVDYSSKTIPEKCSPQFQPLNALRRNAYNIDI
jgi:hypothetical protein